MTSPTTAAPVTPGTPGTKEPAFHTAAPPASVITTAAALPITGTAVVAMAFAATSTSTVTMTLLPVVLVLPEDEKWP